MKLIAQLLASAEPSRFEFLDVGDGFRLSDVTAERFVTHNSPPAMQWSFWGPLIDEYEVRPHQLATFPGWGADTENSDGFFDPDAITSVARTVLANAIDPPYDVVTFPSNSYAPDRYGNVRYHNAPTWKPAPAELLEKLELSQ